MKTPFPTDPKTRGNRSPGVLYAIDGGSGWIYYAQISRANWLGCFRYRTASIAPCEDVLARPVMCHVPFRTVDIGDALRQGKWVNMGSRPVHRDLTEEPLLAQWSVGELDVTVWRGGSALYTASVDDPRVQDIEIMGVWAPQHLPDRLVADFGAEPAEWHVGGPIWRERHVKEEFAKRFPDEPSHQLPPDWVPVNRN